MLTEENKNSSESPAKILLGSAPFSGFAAVVAAHVYDANAEQRVFVAVEEDDCISQYTQVYKPFNESLVEYDRLREVNLSGEGNEQELETASETATNYFFEENCIDVEGIEGEKPENFLTEIDDLDERQAGISRLLAVKVLKDSDAPKVIKKRSFGSRPVSNNSIRLLSTFNGQEVETSIDFKPKRPSDISKYNRLKTRIGLKEGKGFDESKIKIPAQMAAKAAIAEEIGYTSEGYCAGVVPMHHLALALTAYFEKSIKTNQKK